MDWRRTESLKVEKISHEWRMHMQFLLCIQSCCSPCLCADIPTEFSSLPLSHTQTLSYTECIMHTRKISKSAELCEEIDRRNKGQLRLMKRETEEEDEIKGLFMGLMDGYNDNVIPPLSYFSSIPGKEKGSCSTKRHGDEASWAESLSKERKRREQMSQKFSLLQSMLPTQNHTFKPSKDKIVCDTVDYIKYLEAEIQRLEGVKKLRQKAPTEANAKPLLLKCENHNSSVNVRVSNGATFFAVQLPFRHGLVSEIVMVFEKHKAQVLEARVQVEERRLLTFTSTIILGSDAGSAVDEIREEILTL